MCKSLQCAKQILNIYQLVYHMLPKTKTSFKEHRKNCNFVHYQYKMLRTCLLSHIFYSNMQTRFLARNCTNGNCNKVKS